MNFLNAEDYKKITKPIDLNIDKNLEIFLKKSYNRVRTKYVRKEDL